MKGERLPGPQEESLKLCARSRWGPRLPSQVDCALWSRKTQGCAWHPTHSPAGETPPALWPHCCLPGKDVPSSGLGCPICERGTCQGSPATHILRPRFSATLEDTGTKVWGTGTVVLLLRAESFVFPQLLKQAMCMLRTRHERHKRLGNGHFGGKCVGAFFKIRRPKRDGKWKWPYSYDPKVTCDCYDPFSGHTGPRRMVPGAMGADVLLSPSPSLLGDWAPGELPHAQLWLS